MTWNIKILSWHRSTVEHQASPTNHNRRARRRPCNSRGPIALLTELMTGQVVGGSWVGVPTLLIAEDDGLDPKPRAIRNDPGQGRRRQHPVRLRAARLGRHDSESEAHTEILGIPFKGRMASTSDVPPAFSSGRLQSIRDCDAAPCRTEEFDTVVAVAGLVGLVGGRDGSEPSRYCRSRRTRPLGAG